MKKILILAAAATMMVSCYETETINREIDNEAAPTIIGFNTFSDKATRAASEVDLEFYHQTFAVWSTKQSKNDETLIQKVFDGDDAADLVSFDSENLAPNHWTYSPYRYWDKQATYAFVAVAPNSSIIRFNKPENVGDNAGTYVTANTAGYTLTGQNLQATPTAAEIRVGFNGVDGNDTDLMTAAKIEQRDGAAKLEDVVLNFKHILAKLNISIGKDPIYNNVKVVIRDVKVTGLDDNGVYTEATTGDVSGWTSSKVNAGYELSWANANGVELPNSEVEEGKDVIKPLYFIESLVMPQTIEENVEKLVINYTIVSGTDGNPHEEDYNYVLNFKDAEGNKVFENFKEKNNYTLKMTVRPNVITFDATTDLWNDVDPVERDIIPEL